MLPLLYWGRVVSTIPSAKVQPWQGHLRHKSWKIFETSVGVCSLAVDRVIRMWRHKLKGVKDQGELAAMGDHCAKTCMRLLLSQEVYGSNRAKRVSGTGEGEWGRGGVMCQKSLLKPRPGAGLVNPCQVSWAKQVTDFTLPLWRAPNLHNKHNYSQTHTCTHTQSEESFPACNHPLLLNKN